MALEYSLELEGESLDWAPVLAAFDAVGVEDVELVGGLPRSGTFIRSGTFFRTVDRGSPGRVSAENFPKDLFLSRYTIVFRFNVESLESSESDVHEFLLALVSLTPCRFVLSFQFERIYAYRTDRFSSDLT